MILKLGTKERVQTFIREIPQIAVKKEIHKKRLRTKEHVTNYRAKSKNTERIERKHKLETKETSTSSSSVILLLPSFVRLPVRVAVDPSSIVLPDPSLADLIINVDHQREWYSRRPPRESQRPRVGHRIGHRDIDQKGSQKSLKEERVIHKSVRHSLLKQRPNPRLTNHQIRPLHDDDRDKVRRV